MGIEPASATLPTLGKSSRRKIDHSPSLPAQLRKIYGRYYKALTGHAKPSFGIPTVKLQVPARPLFRGLAFSFGSERWGVLQSHYWRSSEEMKS